MVLVVQGSSPYKTLDDLIAAAKAKSPASVSFARGGPASSLHVAIEVIKRAAKIEITYVPYRRHRARDQRADGRPRHRGVGRLSDRGGAAQVRHAARRSSPPRPSACRTLPDVPTLTETGIAKYDADIFYGIVAPAKTPPDELAQLSGWFGTALKAPEVQPKLAQQGLFPVGTVRRAVRRLHAPHHRRIRPHHPRGQTSR